MPHDIPGHRYWSLIDPHWISLNESWDEGPDTFLRALHSAPKKVQHLYAAHWCQSEVDNGGFLQFFYNSTGLLAPESALGFAEVGATALAETVVAATKYFGDAYPRDRDERVAMIPERDWRRRTEWDPFRDFDEAFFAWSESDLSRWPRMADQYANDA